MIGNDLGWFGAATLAFMGWMFWLAGRLAVDPSTPAAGFWVALVVYLAVTAVWVISLTVGGRWRPPATQE
ncbi:hypothetical protein [Aestuariimicrobium ganziense]|uniref:hypothetical protein n=1 Tax=Aestuariimicrobium ganziense TaxID=2773677 RepID=UPI001944F0C5|nr:hypothetical protein [Aestuariimicrobium ganziense]